MAKIKHHERTVHMKTSSTQTSDKTFDDKYVQVYSSKLLDDKKMKTDQECNVEVEKYPCYYCGINIVSENYLYEHKRKRRGMSRMIRILGLPAPGLRKFLKFSTARQP